jgi:NAD-dependent dihydropyrimidine dehydrogenase PreA subunit/coenzyme F420-reducing hydrogenase delta subunit
MKLLDLQYSKPAIHPERCSKVRFSQARCDRCLSICPTHAIQVGYPILEIDDTCSGCGFCVAACPNEVFAFPVDTPGFMKNGERPGTIYCSGLLGQGPSPARVLPSFIVPCLGSIPSSLVLTWVLQEEKPLEVITGTCGDCSMKAGEKQYRQRESEIQSLFDYLGIGFSPVRVSVGSAAEREEASRQREAFRAGVEESKAFSDRKSVV